MKKSLENFQKIDRLIPLNLQIDRTASETYRQYCSEFGTADGYDPTDRLCRACLGSAVCMQLSAEKLEELIDKVRDEGKPFYDENKIREKGEELILDFLHTLKTLSEKGKTLSSEKLMKLVVRESRETLNTLDPEIPRLVYERVVSYKNVEEENGVVRWRKLT